MQKAPLSTPYVQGVVTGSRLEVVGTVTLPVGLGQFYAEPHPILVVKNAGHQCLLGMDFMDRFGVCVNTLDRTLEIANGTGRAEIIGVNLRFPLSTNSHKVVAHARTEIPPRTVMFVDVDVKNVVGEAEGCIESLLRGEGKPMIPRCLTIVRDGIAKIECVNVTDRAITVQKAENLGVFEAVEEIAAVATQECSESESCPADREWVDLFDLTATDLTDRQKQLVHEFLRENAAVVGTSEGELGLTHTLEHRIDVQGSAPIKQPYRRFPPPLRNEIRSEIDKLLKKGIIEPSNSAWSAPLVPVKKNAEV